MYEQGAGTERTDPLSDAVKAMNTEETGAIGRLRRAGYMSPLDRSFTGQGFACFGCDFFRPDGSMGTQLAFARVSLPAGECTKDEIRAKVEEAGCCNRFTRDGVHT